MVLPNAEKAVVDIGKLRDYCLNPNHEVGGNKARVFAAALNLYAKDVFVLRLALLEAVKTNEAVLGVANEFGQRYIVDFDMEYYGKTARIRSIWIIDTGSEIPRLISSYVL